MPKINLQDIYPSAEKSTIDVSDEVLAVFQESKRKERNYNERERRNKAYYSLHLDDGDIENYALFLAPSAEAAAEQKWEMEELYAALDSLPNKQRRRIYAHYILGITKCAIAQTEEVSEASIRESIERGLIRVRKILQKSF